MGRRGEDDRESGRSRAALTIHVRIPGWARNEPVASDLYRFADASAPAAALKVNGRPVRMKLDKGYAVLTRTWRQGDTIELNLPMPVRRVAANGRVAADRGRVALERGPIVYAAEWPDNPQGQVRNLMLPDGAPLKAEFKPALLKGVVVVHGKAVALSTTRKARSQGPTQEFTAIPYYAWANRGRGQMMVWFPVDEAHARPEPYPTISSTAKVTVSGQSRRDPRTINADEDPASSDDPTSYFDWWPRKGIDGVGGVRFREAGHGDGVPASIGSTTRGRARCACRPHGGCCIAMGTHGSRWRRRRRMGSSGTLTTGCAFEPVRTSGLRMEVTMQAGWSAGIQQWRVR